MYEYGPIERYCIFTDFRYIYTGKIRYVQIGGNVKEIQSSFVVCLDTDGDIVDCPPLNVVSFQFLFYYLN